VLFSLVPPEVTHVTPSHPAVLEGSNVTMKCTAVGDPSPVINWFRVSHAQDQLLESYSLNLNELEQRNLTVGR